MKRGDTIEFKRAKGFSPWVRGTYVGVKPGDARVLFVRAWGTAETLDVPSRRVRPIAAEDRGAPRSRMPVHRKAKRPPKFGPIRSENYLAFVRVRPCCVCGAPGPSEPHHFGRRGMGQKTDDLRTVPLCVALNGCHDVFHNNGHFARVGLDSSESARLHMLETQVSLLVAFMGLTLNEAA
jgi:hypothetical protein